MTLRRSPVSRPHPSRSASPVPTGSAARRRAALAGLALAACLAAPAHAEEQVYDGIAAQVGGGVVLISEVDQMARPVEERMRRAGVPEVEIQRMRADVLDRLIEARLIEDVVKRLELTASDQEVDAAIASIARDAGISLQELERSVTAHGLTFEEYREKIRAEIERSKVINTMVRSRVRVEPDEVEALYFERYGSQPVGGEEVHVRHILVASVPPATRTRDEACRIVAEGRERIVTGQANFEAVAQDISDANPQRGGDLGWIHARDLAAWMAPTLAGLESGEVSDVIETPFGCNLLQMVERRKYEPVTYDQAKPQIEQVILRQKMEEQYTEWVDSLRAQTYIEKKPGFGVDGDANPG